MKIQKRWNGTLKESKNSLFNQGICTKRTKNSLEKYEEGRWRNVGIRILIMREQVSSWGKSLSSRYKNLRRVWKLWINRTIITDRLLITNEMYPNVMIKNQSQISILNECVNDFKTRKTSRSNSWMRSKSSKPSLAFDTTH